MAEARHRGEDVAAVGRVAPRVAKRHRTVARGCVRPGVALDVERGGLGVRRAGIRFLNFGAREKVVRDEGRKPKCCRERTFQVEEVIAASREQHLAFA